MNNFREICEKFPNLDNIIFISESKFDSSRKTYLYNNLIIKARKKSEDTTQQLRQNTLKQEYELLKDCDGIDSLPKAFYYFEDNDYELLFTSFLPGVPLSSLKVSILNLIKILRKLSGILYHLSIRKISHNDIVPENILITNDYQISLIDFDQATKSNFTAAFLRQFTGINIGEAKVNYSLITVVKDYIKKKFPKAVFQINKLMGKKFLEIEPLPELKKDDDPRLKDLLNAWKLAQRSNASSPGVPIAYYALEYNGVYFPGERPWVKRWNELKDISDYSGKTILELGCNMGLLSTFLLKDAEAQKCVGVDYDNEILKTAKIISKVFEVNPEFRQVNFDSTTNWEDELLSCKAQIVFALNVLNWVKDKERFLRFLSKFNEVIFEGHDLPENEKNRFKQIGFTTIEVIGFSERERIILRCRK